MATSQLTNLLTGLTAGEDFTNKQYRVVKFASTAGQVIAVTASTNVALGIIQNAPTSGQPALVAAVGSEAIAIAGVNDLAQGELVGYNSTGQVDDTKNDKIAQALQASSAVGDYVKVLVLGLSAS